MGFIALKRIMFDQLGLWFGLQREPNPLYRSKYFCLQSTLCGYSKLVSQDAWHRAKDQNSIRSTWAEKTSKNCWNLQEIKNWYFSSVFWRFLSPGWSDWVLVFCSVSGILRHKFRVPTKGTLKTKIFWPTKGAWLSS